MKRDLTNNDERRKRKKRLLRRLIRLLQSAAAFIVSILCFFYFGKGAFVESEGMRESQQARYVVFHVPSDHFFALSSSLLLLL